MLSGAYNCLCRSRPMISLIRRNNHLSLGYRATRTSKSNMNTGDDQPVQYSGSNAHGWQPEQTYKNPYQDKPAFQAPIIVLSIVVFLTYFCLLREENDLDDILDVTLYQHIDGLEEQQLRQKMEYNIKHGLDVTALKERLDQVLLEKVNKKAGQ